MGRVNAQRLLLIYALINVALCAVVVLGFAGVSVVSCVRETNRAECERHENG